MAQRVAAGPRPADEGANPLRSLEALEPHVVVGRQALVVPADRPTYLHVVGIDPPGRVVCGGDAAGAPIVKPTQLPQPARHGSHARPSLALQLHQVQLTGRWLDPQVGRQPDLGQGPAAEIERKVLDASGAEVPTGDDAVWSNV